MEKEKLLKKFEECVAEKTRFQDLYDDVYKYGMPERYNNIKDVNEKGAKNTFEIFSSSFIQACEGFVQRVQNLLFPVNSPWIDLETGYRYKIDDNVKSQKENIDKELEKIAGNLNAFKDCSNFDKIATQFCYELIAGTGVMLVKEGTTSNPLIFVNIPFKDIYIVDGVNGEADMFFRKLKVKNRLVSETWKGAVWEYDSDAEDTEVEFLEATYYDYKKRLWNYEVINKNKDVAIYKRESKTSPFVDLRWGKLTGESYGRGQGLKVIADVKTQNLIKKYSLQGLAFTIPAFTITEDADIDKFRIEPGVLNPVRSNISTNPPIQQIPVNQQPDLNQYNINQLEMDIKRGMMASTIPNDPSRRTTATEVAERVAELRNSTANTFGTFLEFERRLIARMIDVLQSFGYISDAIEPRNFDGYEFKIKINTELANQQASLEVQRTIQAISYLQALDPQMSYVNKVLDYDKLIPELLSKLGVRKEFIRTTEEIQAMKQQEQMTMQQAQAQAMQNEVAVANAKEEGKANAKLDLQS